MSRQLSRRYQLFPPRCYQTARLLSLYVLVVFITFFFPFMSITYCLTNQLPLSKAPFLWHLGNKRHEKHVRQTRKTKYGNSRRRDTLALTRKAMISLTLQDPWHLWNVCEWKTYRTQNHIKWNWYKIQNKSRIYKFHDFKHFLGCIYCQKSKFFTYFYIRYRLDILPQAAEHIRERLPDVALKCVFLAQTPPQPPPSSEAVPLMVFIFIMHN